MATLIEVELSVLDTRIGALQHRLDYLRSSKELRVKSPMRLWLLEDEIAVAEQQVKLLRNYWSM